MRDASLLGQWIRRFLMEHLVSERNLARNTQRSYRDAFQQLLPAVARRARKPIDRLAVTDVSADRVRQFLMDLELGFCNLSCQSQLSHDVFLVLRILADLIDGPRKGRAKSLVHHSAAGFADGRQSMERPIFRTAIAELAHQQTVRQHH